MKKPSRGNRNVTPLTGQPCTSTTSRPAADATVSDLAGAHVEEAVRDPYRTLTPFLVDTWIEWATEFIEGTPEQGRVEADTAIAVIDGLALSPTGGRTRTPLTGPRPGSASHEQDGSLRSRCGTW